LVVGVGQGHTTRFLSQTGHRVDALDISEDALAKVQPITQRQFTPDRFSSMPERQYDLAISHLVAQHMNDADLELQMYYVCRALKPGGTFALQFSSALLPEERSRMKITRPLDCMEGSVTRSLGIFEQIVSRAGGDIQLVFRHSTYPNYNLIWYVAHVQPFVR
jgi:SAM-dependent methyltransferase